MKGNFFGFLKRSQGHKQIQPMSEKASPQLKTEIPSPYRCDWYAGFPLPNQAAEFLRTVLNQGYELGDKREPVWQDGTAWWCKVGKETNSAGEDSYIESLCKSLGGEYDGWEGVHGERKESEGKNFDWEKALGIG
jgi:hypothetical protein